MFFTRMVAGVVNEARLRFALFLVRVGAALGGVEFPREGIAPFSDEPEGDPLPVVAPSDVFSERSLEMIREGQRPQSRRRSSEEVEPPLRGSAKDLLDRAAAERRRLAGG